MFETFQNCSFKTGHFKCCLRLLMDISMLFSTILKRNICCTVEPKTVTFTKCGVGKTPKLAQFQNKIVLCIFLKKYTNNTGISNYNMPERAIRYIYTLSFSTYEIQ